MDAAAHRRLTLDSASPPVLPGSLLFVFLGGAALGLLSANPLLTAAAILVLPLFLVLLWRPGEPPVLLFAVGFQWAQVTAKVFHANVMGLPVDSLAEASAIEPVIWLSLAGLVVLSGGIHLAIRSTRSQGMEAVEQEVAGISLNRAFILYLVAASIAPWVEALAWTRPGLAQPLLALTSIRWVFFFLLAYLVFRRRERYVFFIVAFAIEFIAGIGFFSGFKSVLFFTLIASFAALIRLNAKTVILGAVCGAALLLLGSVWTVVKDEYRGYLTSGERSQEVVVSRSDQIGHLAGMVVTIDSDDITEGMEPLFMRLAYVDFFGHVMDYVPAVRPHERGELWKAAISHTLMPRVLFPNKPHLPSDSELTIQYTGLEMAGGAEGTSISIGYMGESYIDFGRYGMFAPILILGLLWGLMYRYFVSRARMQVLGFSIAAAVLVNAYQFEMVGIKLLGSMVMSFLVFALFMRFFEPVVWRWLCPLQDGPAVSEIGPAYQPDPT